jgi:phage-related baseplate assembly protein
MTEFITYTTSEILDLFKQEYYRQYGETIQIGSDAFASASVSAYVLSVLCASFNDAAKQRFLDTARGEALDGIAAIYGVNRNTSKKPAVALFSLTLTTGIIPAGELQIATEDGKYIFTNDEINLLNYIIRTPIDILLHCMQDGSSGNDIPAGDVNTVISGASYLVDETPHENTYKTGGGFDGYDGDDDGFREYIKTVISSFLGCGTAAAYEARAMLADQRVVDSYCIRNTDYGYEKGKAKIKIRYVPINDAAILARVQASCDDPSFRPVGDFVEVTTALYEQMPSMTVKVYYPARFNVILDLGRTIAQYHADYALEEYRSYLATHINAPFSIDELCSIMRKKRDVVDVVDVYAVDAYLESVTPVETAFPIYPRKGFCALPYSVTFDIEYRDV